MDAGPEVEELQVRLVARRGRGRMPISTAVLAVALAALLAAGFGVMGGRSEVVPSAAPIGSQVAVASALALSPSLPGPLTEPVASPTRPCRGLPARPPQVFLDVNGASTAGNVWVTGPGQPLPGDDNGLVPASIDIPADATVDLRIDGDSCAIGWHIALSFPEQGFLEAVAVQANPDLDPELGSQNQFELPLAQFRDEPGALELKAALDFTNLQVVARWPLRLLPFERPKPRLVIVHRGIDLPTLEGCETVLTFASGVEEGLPDCDQDLASHLPLATKVRSGTRLQLSFGSWVANQLTVICGAASQFGFLANPPGCRRDAPGLEFTAPDPGDWTIAMATCALQDVQSAGNRICGTWYARIDTR